jgi:hypothetical protein
VTGSVTPPCYKCLKNIKKEAGMADFTIKEDFSKNEIVFDKRFSDPKAC